MAWRPIRKICYIESIPSKLHCRLTSEFRFRKSLHSHHSVLKCLDMDTGGKAVSQQFDFFSYEFDEVLGIARLEHR